MSEIWALKVSCATDMSPTTIFSPGYSGAAVASAAVRHGAGVPGMGMRVGPGGLYRVLPRDHPRTHI